MPPSTVSDALHHQIKDRGRRMAKPLGILFRHNDGNIQTVGAFDKKAAILDGLIRVLTGRIEFLS